MLKIIATNIIHEGKEKEFEAIAKQLVAASQKEEGNISYTLNRSTREKNVYFFLEVWKDQEAIDAHNASSHFQTLVPKMRAFRKDGHLEIVEEVDFE